MAVHELGHFLGAKLARAPVRTVEIGSPPTFRTIPLGNVRLVLGPTVHGRVTWEREKATAGRAALVALAGPVADLATAPALLALPIPGNVKHGLALIVAVTGLSNLMPYRGRSGRLSDGGRLLRAPAKSRAERELRELLELPEWGGRPEAADVLLRAYRLEATEAQRRWPALALLLHAAGRTRDLLWLHQQVMALPLSPSPEVVNAVHQLEWYVATIPGLPLEDANLAGRRLAWVLRHLERRSRPAAQHTLAVIRFRQRQFAQVGPLCADALTAELPPMQRATVLATVAMARHAIGESGRESLDEAIELAPTAELVGEAIAFIDDPKPASNRRRRRGSSRVGASGLLG
jgi:hypothetical protein